MAKRPVHDAPLYRSYLSSGLYESWRTPLRASYTSATCSVYQKPYKQHIEAQYWTGFQTSQYSAWGDVILVGITNGKDCTSWRRKRGGLRFWNFCTGGGETRDTARFTGASGEATEELQIWLHEVPPSWSCFCAARLSTERVLSEKRMMSARLPYVRLSERFLILLLKFQWMCFGYGIGHVSISYCLCPLLAKCSHFPHKCYRAEVTSGQEGQGDMHERVLCAAVHDHRHLHMSKQMIQIWQSCGESRGWIVLLCHVVP